MFLAVEEAGLESELRQPVAVGERGCSGISQDSHYVGAMGGRVRLEPSFVNLFGNIRYTLKCAK